MAFETTTPGTRRYAQDVSSASAVLCEVDGPPVWVPRDRTVDPSLSGHVRRLSKRHHGISRWLAVAVLAGSIVALAFVNFLAR